MSVIYLFYRYSNLTLCFCQSYFERLKAAQAWAFTHIAIGQLTLALAEN